MERKNSKLLLIFFSEICIRRCFSDLTGPKTVNININIDGLPLFNNGTGQIWPILFNIHERPDIKPMVIGVFYGKTKPKKVEEYLGPFAEELATILQSGVEINGFKLTIQLRAFICDSPARSFIKGTFIFYTIFEILTTNLFLGTVNFNSLHGCLKCCTVGVHSTLVRTNIFPQTLAPKRTNEGFRGGEYDDHYQVYKVREGGKLKRITVVSPLLKLPIDMVEDVIVSDSLHLLHLGITKRLLISYKDGHNGLEIKKWSNSEIEHISTTLKSIRLPVEIHREVRGIDCVGHWKGTECASFLHYIGIILLKHYINEDHFNNFANLFCAVIICSADYYKQYLPVARKLFEDFINNYFVHFNAITSNVHNLIHVVDEVKRFGPLHTISSYPFENHLAQLKKLVRSGKDPLEQIANRITEKRFVTKSESKSAVTYPLVKYPVKTDPSKFSHIELSDSFVLTAKEQDRYFLTKQSNVVAMEYANLTSICGRQLLDCTDIFTEPFSSSWLKVYKTKCISKLGSPTIYDLNQILCKLVAVSIHGETSFVPLLHTFAPGEYL